MNDKLTEVKQEPVTCLTVAEVRARIEARLARSAWERGVRMYALELIEDWPNEREVYGSPMDEKDLLNGACDWQQYSEGGCALIYDADIAERLCSPSELRRARGGERAPNARESWLDCQARALYQAANLIVRIARGGWRGE